jgi:hypothetical protein
MENVFFALTEEFNRHGRIAILGSGQAVVWHRLAIMSKDGDWILRETNEACARILDVLARRAARYRPGAPLDPGWLAGGWSSHFELADERGRRVRCDFFSRPPRVGAEVVEALLADENAAPVVDVETLIRMKQTQRAKDYAVIGELARRLPPDRELALTTDVDRILELAPALGDPRRASAAAALGGDRQAVVRTLAEEVDELQQRDRARLERFERAAGPYLAAMRELSRRELALPDGHARVVALARRLLPERPLETMP